VFAVSPANSKLTYFLVHKLHKFDGTSKKVEGKARILPTGQAQVGLRAAVESFDSGNNNRDAHMKEVTEAAKYPTVELKALCDGISLPPEAASVDKTCKAEITFHGIKKAIDLPVKLSWSSPTSVHATAKLSLSLDEFKVERPSLLFVKVDDTMEIVADVVLEKQS
jgi:polyisoprenoid-binding protein YceI